MRQGQRKGRAVSVKISSGWGALALVAALAACSEKEVTLAGIRQDPRTVEIGAEPDPRALAPQPVEARPISLPAAQGNSDWTHRGGTVTHASGRRKAGTL
jgi:hypothetical protein